MVPNLQFDKILNAPVQKTDLQQLKGKIILLEFWATWCGSCLVAMPHLKSLQAKYSKSLQVITLTNESAERTALYIKSRPANFWFSVDIGAQFANIFPHQLIPHTILIDTDGKLIASTNPEAVTEKVIDSLLQKKQVHLPEKTDNLIGHEELIKQRFFATDTVRHRFMMEPEIKGGPGLSTTWLNDKIFSGRRLTCINLSLPSLYMIAYGNYPYSRTLDETEPEGNKSVYCLDLIVDSSADLLPALQKELAKRFDLQARVQLMSKKVKALCIKDKTKFNGIKRNVDGVRTYYSRHGEIDQNAITMADFAQFLENYAIEKLVVDETHNMEKFDIKFSFQPENPGSILEILDGMGLDLVEQKQAVNMLIIYKKTIQP